VHIDGSTLKADRRGPNGRLGKLAMLVLCAKPATSAVTSGPAPAFFRLGFCRLVQVNIVVHEAVSEKGVDGGIRRRQRRKSYS